MAPPRTPSNQHDSDFNSDHTYTYNSFTVPRGLTYHYIHIAPTLTSPSTKPATTKPYIVLLHGFPSHPHDFHHQIQHLSTHLGFGIIAPVLLGYRPTSAPLDANLYRLKLLSLDLIALLDHLNVTGSIHGIGHDWGCTVLSRLEFHHPDRFGSGKLAYLTIAPSPFGSAGKFDLAAVNAMTAQQLGYAAFGYQQFVMRDPAAAAKLMAQRHERMEMLMFAGGEEATELWREYFGRVGGLETWLRSDREVAMLEDVTPLDLHVRREVFEEVEVAYAEVGGSGGASPVVSGYAGPLMYYLALNGNLNAEDEEEQLVKLGKTRTSGEEGEGEVAGGYKTDKHILQVVCSKDPIALPQMHAGMARAYVKDPDRQLRIESLHSGHFVMYEQHEKLNAILEEFFA